MGKYDKLIFYISYFEHVEKNVVRFVFSAKDLTYTKYDSQFDIFIKEVYQPDIMDNNYLEYLKPYLMENQKSKDLITTLDIKLQFAIFTLLYQIGGFLRRIMISAIVYKTLLYLLLKLNSLVCNVKT